MSFLASILSSIILYNWGGIIGQRGLKLARDLQGALLGATHLKHKGWPDGMTLEEARSKVIAAAGGLNARA